MTYVPPVEAPSRFLSLVFVEDDALDPTRYELEPGEVLRRCALCNRATGEVREQLVLMPPSSADPTAARWRRTVARRMLKIPVDDQTPQRLLNGIR